MPPNELARKIKTTSPLLPPSRSPPPMPLGLVQYCEFEPAGDRPDGGLGSGRRPPARATAPAAPPGTDEAAAAEGGGGP